MLKILVLLLALWGTVVAQNNTTIQSATSGTDYTAEIQAKQRTQLDVTSTTFYVPNETPEQKTAIAGFRTNYTNTTTPLANEMMTLRQEMTAKMKAADNAAVSSLQTRINEKQAAIFTHRDKLEQDIRGVLNNDQRSYYDQAVKYYNTKYLRR